MTAPADPLELFPYALMVASTVDEGTPVAIVLTWAMQVSFDPPLVAAAIERDSRIRKALDTAGHFTISFLPREAGTDLAKRFLRTPRPGADEPPLRLSPSRLPYAEGALAWIGCKVRHEIATGDHDTVIGEVVERGGEPGGRDVLTLRDTGWRYHRR